MYIDFNKYVFSSNEYFIISYNNFIDYLTKEYWFFKFI